MIRNKDFLLLEELIYKQKNYSKVISLIGSSACSDCPQCAELLALAYFFQNNFTKSLAIYEKLNNFYHVGYCWLLMGEPEKALETWQKAPSSPAQNWGVVLCESFIDKPKTLPSYLQIRSFLERDLNAFLKLNLVSYVQKVIDISEFLEEINPETNKIIARTFLYNNYPVYAKEYFNRAFDFTTEDAELYYLLALYYQMVGEHADAKNSLRRAIALNDNYVPAKLLLESYGTGS